MYWINGVTLILIKSVQNYKSLQTRLLIGFILRKIGYALLVFAGVITLVFWLFQGLGDPARMMMGQSGDPATVSALRKEFDLDQPKWKQFLAYANDVSPVSVYTATSYLSKKPQGYFVGNRYKVGIKWPYLRKSYQNQKEVTAILLDALSGTLILASAAMLFATILGIFLGTVAAMKKGTWMDTGAVMTSILGVSAPSFFMAILISYLFGFVLNRYTGLSMTGSWYDLDVMTGKPVLTLHNLILPAFTLGIRPLAIITQLTRSSLLDVLQQDYIRTAYAKGLSKWKVLWRHALRNAMNPVITAVTGWFAELLAGAFFVESIFGWKGLGKITVEALEKLDYPVVMGCVLFASFLFVLINILADVLYRIVDPRIRER